MNPFMMMFSPLGGFGFFGGGFGCGCGVNMPYYGMDDRLTFMNFPVFRNTSMDYLLDPRLAMMQAQQSMVYGNNNIFGNTMLPMFNNFPGMNFPGMNNSNHWGQWWNNNKTETAEEKKAREAREAEEKDPKNVRAKEKIDNYKETYSKLKEFLDADTKGSKEYKEFEKKYNEALKEKNIADRLEKLEELFETYFDAKTLRKMVLADKDIDYKLYKIGYNFPSTTSNKHKVDKSKKEEDWKTILTNLEGSLSKDNATPIGILGGMMVDENQPQNKEYILQIISTWNDTHRDENSKGLLRKLADYIPNSAEQVVNWKAGISGLTLAMISKVDSFVAEHGESSDFTKLVAQRKKVSDALESKISGNKIVQKSDVYKLADEFDKLYAMLRIQEAKVMNKEIVDKYADKINGVVDGSIPEDIIISETIKDLETENIAVPGASELDVIPEKESTIRIKRTSKTEELEELDEAADGDGKKLAQLLVEQHTLKAVKDHDGIYESKNSDKNAPKKYYGITEDNKLVEVTYDKETDTYIAEEDAEEVTAVDIGTYVNTVKDIDKYMNVKIKKSKNTEGAYLSIDKHPKTKDQEEYSDVFVIKENKLVKIKGRLLQNGIVKLDNGTKKTIAQLTADDYTEVTSADDIYTKPQKTTTKATTNTTTTTTKQSKNENTKSEAYKKGSSIADKLEGSTKRRDHLRINNTLAAINENDVLDFLAGYYSHDFHEGIIEYLDDEWDGGKITMESKKNLINSLIKCAESKGISATDERIEEIKAILADYEGEGEYSKSKTFNHNDAWWGWIDTTNSFLDGVTAFFGDSKTHNEMIDELIEDLFEELSNKK